jgi:integrase
MASLRPVKRLVADRKRGEGKAEVPTKKRFKHILWMASRGDLGKRNIAIIWMLFGSGLRINEVAKLTRKDLLTPSGTLKKTFTVPSSYTKTGKARVAFILAKQHRTAVENWIADMIDNRVFVSDQNTYRSLMSDMPMFAITKKGKGWRTMAFRDKKYTDIDGVTRTTKVCGSMQNLISEIFKSSGLHHGSTHSGRRCVATWLDDKGVSLENIQMILGHDEPDMTLEYIDPNRPRIKNAFDNLLLNVRVS